VCLLQGDYSKARKKFQWHPTVQFDKLVASMVEEDLKQLKQIKTSPRLIQEIESLTGHKQQVAVGSEETAASPVTKK